jgi:hypothetical protein
MCRKRNAQACAFTDGSVSIHDVSLLIRCSQHSRHITGVIEATRTWQERSCIIDNK